VPSTIQPVFDPVHKFYHVFYQKHVARPEPGAQPGTSLSDGPVWGHWVSKDLVTWAQLPVAIWNTEPYDQVAIYTGSSTVVDGKVAIVYPGLCQRGHAQCPNPTCAGGSSTQKRSPRPTDRNAPRDRRSPRVPAGASSTEQGPARNATRVRLDYRPPPRLASPAGGGPRPSTTPPPLQAAACYNVTVSVLAGMCPGAGGKDPPAKKPPKQVIRP
jgi:hypothetical protein